MLICTLVFIGCKEHIREQNNIQKETLDTIFVKYDLENISTEGCYAKAKYLDSTIIFLDLYAFTNSSQVNVTFNFFLDSIELIERVFKYSVPIEQVKDKSDLILIRENNLTVDYNGKTIYGTKSETDLFGEVKKQIPFVLK